ncbi:MAG: integrase [Mesorhizobium sp.]|nr:MAG: integrase [Mesorhizobium sp.]
MMVETGRIRGKNVAAVARVKELPLDALNTLGHSTIGITLDLYSHVMPGMQADAAEQVDAALQVAITASRKTI